MNSNQQLQMDLRSKIFDVSTKQYIFRVAGKDFYLSLTSVRKYGDNFLSKLIENNPNETLHIIERSYDYFHLLANYLRDEIVPEDEGLYYALLDECNYYLIQPPKHLKQLGDDGSASNEVILEDKLKYLLLQSEKRIKLMTFSRNEIESLVPCIEYSKLKEEKNFKEEAVYKVWNYDFYYCESTNYDFGGFGSFSKTFVSHGFCVLFLSRSGSVLQMILIRTPCNKLFIFSYAVLEHTLHDKKNLYLYIIA
jgi:hypothetical protein